MTASMELDLKQRLARLSERERMAMSAYLLQLKHQSKKGQTQLTKVMKAMDQGRKTRLEDLAAGKNHD